jgi:hypothetical protein
MCQAKQYATNHILRGEITFFAHIDFDSILRNLQERNVAKQGN